VAGKFNFLFQGKIIKSIETPKCAETYLQTYLIPQFSRRDIPRPSLKRGKGRTRREDGEKKRGSWRLRHGCRNQNCASAPVVANWPTLKSQSCMLSACSKWSRPAFRWGNSTHREMWPVVTASYHRLNHSSEFRIGSSVNAQRLDLTNVYKRLSHDKRVKIHHSCSCKQSAVHTRWRR